MLRLKLTKKNVIGVDVLEIFQNKFLLLHLALEVGYLLFSYWFLLLAYGLVYN